MLSTSSESESRQITSSSGTMEEGEVDENEEEEREDSGDRDSFGVKALILLEGGASEGKEAGASD